MNELALAFWIMFMGFLCVGTGFAVGWMFKTVSYDRRERAKVCKTCKGLDGGGWIMKSDYTEERCQECNPLPKAQP